MSDLIRRDEIIDSCYAYLGDGFLEVFGSFPIFYKLRLKIYDAKKLACPRCGNKGVLMYKPTVSKGKYRYRKLYVYHETESASPVSTVRFQKWCYLNKAQLTDPLLEKTVRSVKHAKDVEEYFYRSLRIPR